MDWSAVAIVLATTLGPVLAVWASEYRQKKNAEDQRREWVFRTLWATRAIRLHQDHVAALNQIDLAFPAQYFPKVAEAWNIYLGHLNTPMGSTEAGCLQWGKTGADLFINLVHQMASDIGISLPMNVVKLSVYHPEAHVSMEERQKEIQTLLAELLRGDRAINVKTKE